MARFFIERPIFASVISILIVLAGVLALGALPVEQYPDLAPPSVQVTTLYPGATAEVIAETVAAPLEEQINGVDKMIYMQSTSTNQGTLALTVYFEIGSDPDMNTVNVSNRVQTAMNSLPQSVRDQGVKVIKASTSILKYLAIYSPGEVFDVNYLSNYAAVNIVDEIKRLDGVGDCQIFGDREYSIRVWLRPDKMATLGVTPSDVSAAILEQNSQFTAGSIGNPPSPAVDRYYTFVADKRFSDASQFEEIILRAKPDGTTLRLKDVADVELGASTYTFSGKMNGQPSIPIGIFLSPGANAVAVSEAVDATIASLAKRFPQGIEYVNAYDTTDFVRVSIHEVVKTLLEAILLVVLVIYIFLKDLRATVIAVLAIPISIIGTFAGMLGLGFSVNMLTLFGLVLAIGIVVDDAIVVIENTERIMHEDNLPVKEATIKAMDEISGPLIAMVLVLCAMFGPVGFLGGMTGILYKQFAITICVSVVISGVVALSLTPTLCVLLIRERSPEEIEKKKERLFDRVFAHVVNRYVGVSRFLLDHSFLAVAGFVGIIAVTGLLFTQIPGGLMPDEDQGAVFAAISLEEGAAFSRTEATIDKMDAWSMKQPDVRMVMSLTGFDLVTGGTIIPYKGTSIIVLKDWSERKGKEHESFALLPQIYQEGLTIPEARVLPFNPPAIMGMSNTGGFEGYIQDRGGGDIRKLAAAVEKVLEAGAKRPELTGLSTGLTVSSPQLRVVVDRTQAKAYGVSLSELYGTLAATFGMTYVNDYTQTGLNKKVYVQSRGDFRTHREDMERIFCRSDSGAMVPLSSLVDLEPLTGSEILVRFNVFSAAQVLGNPAPGYSSGQAIDALEQVCNEVLPEGYSLAWFGEAYQEKEAGSSSTSAFVLGIIVVFLILSALYERWSLPLAVVTAIPFALLGAFLFTWVRGLENDLYFQIALVTLAGLASKNAILIVEFAAAIYAQGGTTLKEAALSSLRIRFRPFVMTATCFILGCLPLVVATGAGANSRVSIGTGIVGGMITATVLAALFIPFFFTLIMSASERFNRPKGGGANGGKTVASIGLALLLTLCAAGASYAASAAPVVGFGSSSDIYEPPTSRDVTKLLEGVPAPASGDFAIDVRWWERYDDPVLNRLETLALENNLDLASAMAQVAEARARSRLAHANRFPEVDLGGGAGKQQVTRDQALLYGGERVFENYSLEGFFSYEVDLWGRYRRLDDAGRAQLAATEAARDTIRLAVTAQVARTYFQLRTYDAQLDLSRKMLAAQEEILRLYRARYEAGYTGELDLRRIEADTESTRSSVSLLENAVSLTETALAVLIGRNPAEYVALGVDRGRMIGEMIAVPEIPGGISSWILAARPDIRQAEQSLSAAAANVEAARANLYPAISLTADAGYASSSLSDLFKGSSGIWSFAANLFAPIWDGGRRRENVRITQAMRDQMVIGYAQAIQTAFKETYDSLTAYRKSVESLRALAAREAASRRSYEIATVQNKMGYIALTDLLDIQRTYLAAQMDAAQGMLDRLNSTVDVCQAFGGGWSREPAKK